MTQAEQLQHPAHHIPSLGGRARPRQTQRSGKLEVFSDLDIGVYSEGEKWRRCCALRTVSPDDISSAKSALMCTMDTLAR